MWGGDARRRCLRCRAGRGPLPSVLPCTLHAECTHHVHSSPGSRSDRGRLRRGAAAGGPGRPCRPGPAVARRRLPARRAADPGRQLLLVPRARRGHSPGATAPRHAGGRVRGAPARSRRRARRRRGEPAAPAHHPRRRAFAHAAAGAVQQAADGRAGRGADAVDRRGRVLGPALVVRGRRRARASRRVRRGVGAQPARPVRARAARGRGVDAGERGRQADSGPPGGPRPDGAAPRSRPPRVLSERHLGRRLGDPRRPAARVAALGRAPRPLLARRGALRRHPRHPHRQLPRDVRVARLGDPGVQREQALRRLRGRAGGRRPPAGAEPRSARRHRLPAQQHHHQRGRGGARGVRGDLRQGPGRDHRQRLPRADRGLRHLPRPQVRSDRAERVLRDDRVLPEHHPVRHGRQRLRPAAHPRGARRRRPRALARAARRGGRARRQARRARGGGEPRLHRVGDPRRTPRRRDAARARGRAADAGPRRPRRPGRRPRGRAAPRRPRARRHHRGRPRRPSRPPLRRRVLGRAAVPGSRRGHAVLHRDVDLPARGRGQLRRGRPVRPGGRRARLVGDPRLAAAQLPADGRAERARRRHQRPRGAHQHQADAGRRVDAHRAHPRRVRASAAVCTSTRTASASRSRAASSSRRRRAASSPTSRSTWGGAAP